MLKFRYLVEARRLELLTSGLQSPRSAKLSYAPTKFCWWAWVDSNYRPHAYQACALTN
jgi:hypothetical protein